MSNLKFLFPFNFHIFMLLIPRFWTLQSCPQYYYSRLQTILNFSAKFTAEFYDRQNSNQDFPKASGSRFYLSEIENAEFAAYSA